MFRKMLDRIARNCGYFTSTEVEMCVRSAEREAFKFRRKDSPLKEGGGDDISLDENGASPIFLDTAMRILRLHGFALVYYGGNALHKAVGAPTERRCWEEDLFRAVFAIAGQESVQSSRLAASIENNLFDLNHAGEAGIEVARMISSGRKA